jgi:hypothetical protein
MTTSQKAEATLDEAIRMLQWGITNNISSIRELENHYGLSDGYFRKRRARATGLKGYAAFMSMFDRILNQEVNKKNQTKPQPERPDTSSSTYSESQNGEASYEYTGKEEIKNLDDAIRFFKIDTKLYEITKFTCSSSQVSALHRDQDLTWEKGVMSGHAIRKPEWEKVTNYSVKVYLKKRETVAAAFDFKKFYVDLLSKEERRGEHTGGKSIRPSLR